MIINRDKSLSYHELSYKMLEFAKKKLEIKVKPSSEYHYLN